MPLDPNIVLRGLPPPPPLQSPFEALQLVEQLRDRREQGEARRAALEDRRQAGEERRQKAADEAAARQRALDVEAHVQGALTLDPTTGRPTLDFNKLLGGGVPVATTFALSKAADEAAKTLVDLDTAQIDLGKKRTQAFAGLAQPVKIGGYAKPLWDAALLAAYNKKYITADERDAGYALTDPTAIKRATDSAIAAAGGEQKLEKVTKYNPETGQTVETFVTPTEGAEFVQPPGKTGEQVSHQSEWVLLPGDSEPKLASYNPKTRELLYQGKDVTAVARRVPPPLPQGPYMWAVPPGGTTPQLLTPSEIRTEGAERPPEPSTAAQSAAAGYAARIAQAEPTFTKVTQDIRTMSLPAFELQTNSWFAKPTFQSAAVQQYMQAARNFINANLRRESGAAISPGEFAEARAQYLPQPGDTDEAKALKDANRAQILANMKNEAGRAYQGPIGGAGAGAAPKEGTEGTVNGVPAVWKTVNGKAGWYKK